MSSPDLVDLIGKLLAEDKTIRDPIHGDIVLNLLESSVIDTQIFQRLRRIKQLGTVDLVFPGAEHSRFQHSLGTLYMANLLVDNIFKNCPEKMSDLQKKMFALVVRLSALLHDVYELPFSHTLEKEGHVFEKQWKDEDLNKFIFGIDSQLFLAILRTISEIVDRSGITDSKSDAQKTLTDQPNDLPQNLTSTIIALVYKILTETNEKPSDISKTIFSKKLKFLEIFDERFLCAAGYIIRNTICADLLDYLLRDFYFCGIDKKYDKRFLVYSTFFFPNGGSKGEKEVVFAYSLIDKRGKLKQSVLSSLFDVLELRYSLAEMVHTHRVKNAFSVMMIEAFNLYYQSMQKEKQKEFRKLLMTMGDGALIEFLKRENSDAKYVLDYYSEHNHYQEFVLWDKWENAYALSKQGLEFLNNAGLRLLLEKTLVKWINKRLTGEKKLRDGDLLIYVMPDPEHLWKEMGANVIYQGTDDKPEVSTLEHLSVKNVLNPKSPMMSVIVRRIEGQRKLLQEKYCNLWRVSLFLSPKIDCNKDADYATIPGELSDLISKIFRLQGIDAQPTEIRAPIVMPEELNKILLKIKAEKRSFCKMKELYDFPV